jgi:hypothetical protein
VLTGLIRPDSWVRLPAPLPSLGSSAGERRVDNAEAAGSTPARGTHGAFGYGLGPEPFDLGKRVRVPHALLIPTSPNQVWHRAVNPTTRVAAGSNPAVGAPRRARPVAAACLISRPCRFDSGSAYARVAQRREHPVHTREIGGSSPSVRTVAKAQR